jgi:hypothetical protein
MVFIYLSITFTSYYVDNTNLFGSSG